MRLALVLIVVASTARASPRTIDEAFPPTLGITSGDLLAIDRFAVEGGEDVTWVRFRVSSPRRFGASTVSLDVPVATRILGIETGRGDTRSWGEVLPRATAQRRFHEGGEVAVVHTGSSAGVDHLVVDVDGVTVRDPLEIALAVQFPALASPHEALQVVIDGVRREPIALAALASREPRRASDLPFVDAQRSLLASTLRGPRVVVGGMHGPRPVRWLDKAILRRQVRAHHAQLRGCYVAVAQWQPAVQGTAVLRFTIDGRGAVIAADVGGDLRHPKITACLAAELRSWTFPESDEGRVEVNYPITFRMTE